MQRLPPLLLFRCPRRFSQSCFFLFRALLHELGQTRRAKVGQESLRALLPSCFFEPRIFFPVLQGLYTDYRDFPPSGFLTEVPFPSVFPLWTRRPGIPGPGSSLLQQFLSFRRCSHLVGT